MAKYRDHRGGLAESLATMVVVDSRAELVEYLRRALSPFFVSVTPDKVKILPYCVDARIGWDTHIVTIDGYGVAGFTDGPLEDS